jgi:hypothetical protein
MDLNAVRSYRIQLEQPFYNSNSLGISIFDLFMTFFIAYIIEPYVRVYTKLNRQAYYLALLPLGVVSHSLSEQHTFLNGKLFDDSINLYKIIMIIIIIKLIYELNNSFYVKNNQ